ncbi:MAG: imidazole glycerol phosphate synthase subunit HisH, partial [Acidobacteria bacterium]|nr:imidazole glycerol phosphate synthase subunit HisH [Acidobacteriota bacterium]
MIAIVDYGLGNVQAIANIYQRLNIDVRRASTPAELAGADRFILPGVGAFDWAM